MGTNIEVHVDAESFRDVRKELFNFDRELLGKLNSRIKRAVEPVVREAVARSSVLGTITRARKDGTRVPSGLARTYMDSRKGIKVKVGGRVASTGNDAIVRLVEDNKAVAIAEFAESSNTPEGTALIRRLGQYGSPGRFLWAAAEAHQQAIREEIQAEIAKTQAEYNARLAAGTAQGVRS